MADFIGLEAESIMRLTVVGSSDALNSLGRSHSSSLLEGDGVGPLMIDFGATSLAALRKIGRNPTELRGIALTHLHGDHVGGFAFLVIDGMYNEVRRHPLAVVGPRLTAERIDTVLRTAYGSLADDARPFEMPIREVEPGGIVEVAGVTIEAFAADHMDPPDCPLCLRISANGKVIAFSGDTRICDGLFAAAEGADLLVAECTALTHPCGRHCAWEDWRALLGPGIPNTSGTAGPEPRARRTIGAKRVLFTHLGRAVRERAADLVNELPGAAIAFAEDGMVVMP